jgi:hypothetical protein
MMGDGFGLLSCAHEAFCFPRIGQVHFWFCAKANTAKARGF